MPVQRRIEEIIEDYVFARLIDEHCDEEALELQVGAGLL